MSVTFADLGAPREVVAALAAVGIVDPLPIQAAAIPDAMAGRDVCGSAPTGSGKTLAFGVPLVATVARAKPGHPRGLVLVPTRELAEQISRELAPLAASRRLATLAVYGGVGYEGQRRSLRRGVDVLVACPGRLGDLIRQGWVRLDEVDHVVIDEADRMADMGFLPEVKRLLEMTATDRQTVLFSATLDGEVAALTQRYQRDPVRHEVAGVGADEIDARHFFWRVDPQERIEHTVRIVSLASPTIVFCQTRHGADRVAKQLAQSGASAVPIHGGRTQPQRSNALDGFARGRVRALVATDVAARGIHVEGVACVVHFDPPTDAKTYMHRSGRTARVGASGLVVSFVGSDQIAASRRMQGNLGLSGGVHPIDIASLGEGGERIDLARRSSGSGGEGGGRRGTPQRSGRGGQQRSGSGSSGRSWSRYGSSRGRAGYRHSG